MNRRTLLKATVALPALAFPLEAGASEPLAFTQQQAWVAEDTNNEMLDLMIEAAQCSEISLDLIYNIVSPLHREIAVHVCQTIIAFEKARGVEWYVYRPTKEYLASMENAANKGDVFVKKPVRIAGYEERAVMRIY